MRVSRWGNSLAVRLPKDVVAALGLAEGDEIELTRREPRLFEIAKLDRRQAIERLRKYRGRLPGAYRFDRNETNAR
jgi:antitoxin MazE